MTDAPIKVIDADTHLTEPHDMLNTGIEMEARPSGKMVRRLSLLSGGERSLAALAPSACAPGAAGSSTRLQTRCSQRLTPTRPRTWPRR